MISDLFRYKGRVEGPGLPEREQFDDSCVELVVSGKTGCATDTFR